MSKNTETKEILQDTLHFTVTEETTVKNDTVKIEISVSAIVNSTTKDSELRTNISKALKGFIDVDWSLHNITRINDVGLEKVSLYAVARVPESENYNIENRLREISKEGLQLNLNQVDTSIPTKEIEAAHTRLRAQIYKRVSEEAVTYNSGLYNNKSYRVHEVNYDNDSFTRQVNNMSRTPKGGAMYASAALSLDDASSSMSLGVTQKVSLTASVTLATIVKL